LSCASTGATSRQVGQSRLTTATKPSATGCAGRASVNMAVDMSSCGCMLVVCGLEVQCDRIDAVPQAGGRARPVVEDVAQVRPAAPAAHLRAHHAMRAVLHELDVLPVEGLIEARPARARLELGIR